MDQKQSDILTLIHLIKTESKRTREELVKHFDEKLASEIKKSEKRLQANLTSYLDNKFEDHRRKIVDEIQTFEDYIVKENVRLDQESVVNSSRLKKLENQVFSN